MSESSNRQRVAIAGATGYIGGRLAPRLLDAGYSIRCLVRSSRKLEARKWVHDSCVEVRETDLANAESVAHNLEGCDAAFYLIHSMTSAGATYADKDRQHPTKRKRPIASKRSACSGARLPSPRGPTFSSSRPPRPATSHSVWTRARGDL